jgi:hypothetical protein
MRARRCKEQGCSTRLSTYNRGVRCYRHARPDYAVPRPIAGPRPAPPEAFLRGVAGVYTLTPAEAARYWTGEWIGGEA